MKKQNPENKRCVEYWYDKDLNKRKCNQKIYKNGLCREHWIFKQATKKFNENQSPY